VADDYADLWDGFLAQGLGISETGGDIERAVWTGTDGRKIVGLELGTETPRYGLGGDGVTNNTWITEGGTAPKSFILGLYAMSGSLVVEAAAIPEPSSAILLGLVAGGGLIRRSRRKRRQASSAA
jgi:hypothetical protein